MEYAILTLSLVSGAIFRRWWGGWFHPNGLLKRVLGFILPLAVCFVVLGNSYLALALAAIILFGWLMPYHGYGIGMGSNPDHPLWACLLVMGLQYGLLTTLAGKVWEYMLPHSGGLYYAPMGYVICLGYYISSKIGVKPWGEYPHGNWLIDGYTCYGELILGAVLVGGIPLARLIGG